MIKHNHNRCDMVRVIRTIPSSLLLLLALFTAPAVFAQVVNPNLAVALVATPDPVWPGERVFYTLTYANRTGGQVNNWKVVATVPEYTKVLSSGEASGGTCSVGYWCGPGGTITWTVASLAAGESRSVTFAALVDSGSSAPANGTLLRSTATVTADVAGSVSASADVVVQAAPPMSLGVVESQDPVVRSGALTYTLTLGNRGAVTSPAGVLSMVVPAGTTFVSATGGGSLVGGTMQWNVGAMAAGTSGRYQLVVQVGAGAVNGDVVVGTADFSAGATSVARAKVATAVAASPLVAAVALVATPDPVWPGERVFYTLTYANRTGGQVNNWKVVATVPEYTKVLSSGEASGGTCSVGYWCGPGGTITWTVASLAAGESRSVTFAALVDSGSSAPANGTLLRSTATVTADVAGSVSASADVVVQAAPPMSLGVVESQDPVVRSGALTYTLTLGNRGAVTSPAGVLSMVVPAGTTFVSATGGGSLVGGTMQWNVGAMAAGTSGRYQLVVQVGAGAVNGDVVVGTADFSAGATSVARAKVATAVAASPLVAAVALVATPDPVWPGERVFYTLTYANRTGGQVNNWKVVATVPEYTKVLSSGEASGGTCSVGYWCGPGGTITWTVASLAAGESRSVTFAALVDSGSSAPANGTLLRSTATVTADVAGSVSASADVVVQAAPPMSLGVVESQDPVVRSGALTYTLTLGNRGAVTSPAGVLSMVVPAGTTFVSATGGGSLVGGTMQWNVGAMAAGTSGRYQLVVQVGAGAVNGDVVVGTADFSAGATSVARAKVATAVAASPLVAAVALVATPDPVWPGERVFYTLTYANRTGGQVNNWKVVATVPEYTKVLSSGEASGGTCSVGYWCGPGGTITWTVASLAAGESRSVTFAALVDSGSSAPANGTLLRSTATVTADVAGSVSASADVVVQAAPPMSLGVVESQDPVVRSGALTYTLTLGNRGAVTSPAGVLSMVVPAGTTFVSATGGGSLVGGTMQWNVGAMAAGTSGRYQLVVQVGAGAVNGDVVVGTADFSAGATSVARAKVATAVAASPLVAAVALVATPDPVWPGERVFYTLTYANRTGGQVNNWKVVATVPEYTKVLSSGEASGGTCSVGYWCGPGGTITWTVASLAAGESRSVTFAALVDSGSSAPANGTLLRSTATVTADVAGSVSASADVVVQAAPPMSLGVVESQDPVVRSGALTYTLTLGNRGAVTSPAGVLSMVVPAGTTFVSATGGGSLVGGTMQWNVGAMAAGTSGRYQLVVQVGAGAVNGDVVVGTADFSAGATSVARAKVATAVAASPLVAAVALVATPDPVWPGERVFYTLTYANRTGGQVNNWKVVATVPEYTKVLSSGEASGGTCSVGYWCGPGGTITWTVASLAAGESRSVTFAALVDSGSSAPANGTLLRSTATVTADVAGSVSAIADVEVRAGSGCTTGGTVSGKVLDGATGKGLPGAQVNLDGSSVTSGSTGSYSFAGVSGGLHLLGASTASFSGGGVLVSVCRSITVNILLTKSMTTYGLRALSGYAADPVNTATGNYTLQRVDLKLPGRGFGFAFERGYNSQDPLSGPLGYGWTHNFNASLALDGDGNAVVRWGDGRTETYPSNGAGGYTAQYGVFDTLAPAAGGWTLTKKDGRRFGFDSGGKLTSIVDRNGNTQTLTYSAGRLTQVTDTAGRAVNFSYDGSGRIVQLADPLGRTVQFGYDVAGNLISSTDPAGKATTYTYDANHQLLTATDPRGNVFVSNTYDATNRVVTSQRDAKLGQTLYGYDSTTRRTTITDPLGQVTVHSHDSLLRLIEEEDALGNKQSYVYDAAGNRTLVTDRNGNNTAYAYDAAGNVTQKTNALSQVTTVTYDGKNNPLTRTDALGKVTTLTYDAKGNLLTVTDPLGQVVTHTYNAAGQVLTQTDPRGNVTSHSYDGQGNLAQVTTALGQKTTFTYDAVGRRLTRTDALGRVTTTAYDADDNVVTVTDPAAQVTSFSYDGNNNRVTVTDPLGRVTTTTYDQKDLPTTVTNALGGTTTTAYDALDRKTAITDPRGKVTQFAYDPAGRVSRTTDALGQQTYFTHDAHGNRVAVTDALNHTTTFNHDALHRLTQVTDALGNLSSTAYDAVGRVTATTNAKGQTTTRQYDAVGRLTQVTDAAGGIVTYGYDAAGNRTAQTDPRGNVTSYTYDALNRLLSKTEPGARVTQYAYDAVGNRSRITQPNGTILNYTYDGLDRLTRITYPDATQVNFTYDAKGNRKTLVDGLGTTTSAYDALDRLTSRTDPYGKAVNYEYDASGNLTALVYPDGKRVTYAYDNLNRLTGVTDWASRTTTYAYDAAGRVTGNVLPNGTQAAYGYDNGDRLTSLSHRLGAAAPFAAYSYALDPLGNHTQVTATEPLAPVLVPGTTSYSYDADNRLTNAGGTAQGFDANGNLTTSGASSFVWDYEDRLEVASIGSGTQTYTYDGVGNRLSRTAQGVTTRFVLDTSRSLAKVLAETDMAGAIGAYYVYGLGLVARVAADGGVRYYHHDSRGSTVALTDGAGTLTDRYAYDPFGTTANSQGTTTNPFKYVGRYGLMDEGNGLIYVRARYYDPTKGRFLSKDTLPGQDIDSQSLHRFVYALNRPINIVDITGLSAQESVGQKRIDVLYPGEYIEKTVCIIICKKTRYGVSFSGVKYKKVTYDVGVGLGGGYMIGQSSEEPDSGWDGKVETGVRIPIIGEGRLSGNLDSTSFSIVPGGVVKLEGGVAVDEGNDIRLTGETGVGFNFVLSTSLGSLDYTELRNSKGGAAFFGNGPGGGGGGGSW